MSYIIVAEVDEASEMNTGGDPGKVRARILSRENGRIAFDVRGEFGREPGIIQDLVASLLDAGFYDFSIRHSY